MVSINNGINNTVGASNSGVTNTLTVTNASDTASSQALLNVTVGGTSAGDAFATYTVAGTTNWSEGIDNSVSGDPFVISASTALGTTNVMSMTTAGAVSCVLGNLDVTKSASGADVSVTASNTSNTASSNATHYATVAGSSAGDAQIQYAVSGTTTWTEGIDNSASDAYVLAASTALGTTNVISASTAGVITYPLQPTFLAYLPSNVNNVTGDSSTFQIGTTTALTEIFDVGGNFNTNGTFTAPVTGTYYLQFAIYLGGGTGISGANFQISTSNRVYRMDLDSNPPTALTTSVNGGYSTLADMDSADTAVFTITAADSGGKVDDLVGSAAPLLTWCSGRLEG